MSEPAIPLWKQELLKRRQKKILKDGNLVVRHEAGVASSRPSSGITTNHSRDENVSSHSSRVPNTNKVTGNVRKGELHSQNGESIINNATRQIPDPKENRVKSGVTVSSGCGQPNESPSNIKEDTKRNWNNEKVTKTDMTSRNRLEDSDIPRLGGESTCSGAANQIHSSIHLDDSEKERLKALVSQSREVDVDDHIRPRALKIMWKMQESKQHPELQNTGTKTSQQLPYKNVSPVTNASTIEVQHKKASPVNHVMEKEGSEILQRNKHSSQITTSENKNYSCLPTDAKMPHPRITTSASKQHSQTTTDTTTTDTSRNHSQITTSARKHHPEITTSESKKHPNASKHHSHLTTSTNEQHSQTPNTNHQQIFTGTNEHHHKITTGSSKNHAQIPTSNVSKHHLKVKMPNVSPVPPKAYKSPYAKRGWNRPQAIAKAKLSPQDESMGSSNFDHRKSIQSHKSSPPEATQVNTKIENVGSASTNGSTPLRNRSASMQDISESKVENEHIPSVKSLLGLFGEKSTGGKKVRIIRNSEKEVGPKSPVSPTSDVRPKPGGGLARHHSEPNLYSPNKGPANSLQMSNSDRLHSKVTSKDEPVDEVVSPSHQVSSGIKERMTLLRKRSLSLNTSGNEVEETAEKLLHFPVKNANNYEGTTPLIDHNGPEQTKDNERHVIDPLPAQILTSKAKHEYVNHASIGKPSTVISIKPDKDKKLSNTVNNDRILGCSDGRPKPNLHNMKLEPEEQAAIVQQTVGNNIFLSGSKSSTKMTVEADIKAPKSGGKIINKQSNYIQADQSKHSFGDQVVSTTYSNGINQNQHESKNLVIKNEHHRSEPNIEAKQRKSLLNITDPLETVSLRKQKEPTSYNQKPSQPDSSLSSKELEIDSKPKNTIIHQHEPDSNDNKTEMFQALELNNDTGGIRQPVMPVSSESMIPQKEPVMSKAAIPVTPIDIIPVSAIDNIAGSHSKKPDKGNGNLQDSGTLAKTNTAGKNTVEEEQEIEFIPISSIDDDSSLTPPHVIHEKHPEDIKSCLTTNKIEKKGNVSFFQHVFIHDYQSEGAATSDWDYENGEAFSSYTPSVVKQYSDVTANSSPPPVSAIAKPEPEESKSDEPTIIYNEEDSVGFTESFDMTAGAMLF